MKTLTDPYDGNILNADQVAGRAIVKGGIQSLSLTVLTLHCQQHSVAAKLTFLRATSKIASLRLLPCASPIFGEGKGTMKPEIHPSYNEISVVCACGHTFKTRSTLGEDLHVEICSDCHPFFTGKQKLVDTAGRVDRFNKRYQRGGAAAAK